MPKEFHELRDPIHVFIRMYFDERKVLNTRPFQRLRHIHQLALTNLVYPGATYRCFKHSLGVMESLKMSILRRKNSMLQGNGLKRSEAL